MIKSKLYRNVVLSTCGKNKTGITKGDINKMCKSIYKILVDSLEEGKRIEIRYFGSIKVLRRPARVVNNPITNKLIKLEARSIPFYRASYQLKKEINDSRENNKIKDC